MNPLLPLGYSPVPPGHVVNAVTCLEMLHRPAARPGVGLEPPFNLEPLDRDDLAGYRALFGRVGEPWLWSSRLAMPDGKLAALLADPQIELYALSDGAQQVGILELDFRQSHECELAFFGLAPAFTGKGLGRALMDAAIGRAWATPIRRFWVHTCTFDHPSALAFYQRSGFRPFAFQVEVMPDPRLAGRLPRTAAPHIPLIEVG
jgi:GNAT superfamily N-acetyltransferase